MYQYSLEFFIRFFRRRLEVSTPSTDVEERLNLIIEDITFAFYSNICRGLFEKDKLLFSFIIAAKIQLQQKILEQRDWNFFLRGAKKQVETEIEKPDYLNDLMWNNCLQLEQANP